MFAIEIKICSHSKYVLCSSSETESKKKKKKRKKKLKVEGKDKHEVRTILGKKSNVNPLFFSLSTLPIYILAR